MQEITTPLDKSAENYNWEKWSIFYEYVSNWVTFPVTRCVSAVQKGPDQLGELPNRLTQNFTFYFFFLLLLCFQRFWSLKDQARKSVQRWIPLTKSLLRKLRKFLLWSALLCLFLCRAKQRVSISSWQLPLNVIRKQTGLFCVRTNPAEEAAHLTASSVFNLLLYKHRFPPN